MSLLLAVCIELVVALFRGGHDAPLPGKHFLDVGLGLLAGLYRKVLEMVCMTAAQ